MRERVLRSITVLTLLAAAFSVAALAVSVAQQRQGATASKSDDQAQPKTLREIAMERDVEVSSGTDSESEYETLEELTKDAHAIVYGWIIDSKSFFDESGHPIEYGDVITTEYTVDVYRVVRDTKLNTALEPGQPTPAPLTTPLKIARNGGVVYVNGHRAEVKVKGHESLKPGRQYVFFLFWNPAYRAYTLAGGISGAVIVNDDLSLKPLASSGAVRSKLRGVDLETFINGLGNRD